MNKKERTYTFFQRASSFFLLATLLWLIASPLFAFACQQESAKQQKILSASSAAPTGDNNENEGASSNGLEEKMPSVTNLSEEFIYEYKSNYFYLIIVLTYYKQENADSYIAFHGELLVPPPNKMA